MLDDLLITEDEWRAAVVPELEAAIGQHRNRPWKREEIAVLLRYHGKVSAASIAAKLGRSVSSLNTAWERYRHLARE